MSVGAIANECVVQLNGNNVKDARACRVRDVNECKNSIDLNSRG